VGEGGDPDLEVAVARSAAVTSAPPAARGPRHHPAEYVRCELSVPLPESRLSRNHMAPGNFLARDVSMSERYLDRNVTIGQVRKE
jgi:hypothetical protein